jgi:DNA-binding transcriptional MerR regulator
MSKPKLNSDVISAQMLAERADEPYDTVNHWARMGLLPYKKVGRNRFFSAADAVNRCKRIRELQNEDCNLAAIRRMIAKDG